MKIKIYLSIAVLVALSSVLNAQLLHENLKLASASVSYLVIDADTGDEILSYNPNLSMTPASVLKIISTASALDKFGESKTFTTKLMYSGEIENGTLNGNIYIVGGGDPALGSLNYQEHYYQPVHFLQSWVVDVKNAGIKRITGNVYAVENQNLSDKVPRTWIWEDMANHFGASPGSLNVYDNLYHIHFNTQGKTGDFAEIVNCFPDAVDYEFTNAVKIADGGGDQAYVFGAPDSKQRFVKGALPKGYSDFVVKGSVSNPAQLLATQFLHYLVSAGVPVSGCAETVSNPSDKLQLITDFSSPSLADLAKTTNHKSINLYANMLGLMFSENYNMEEASLSVIEYWKNKGMDTDGLFLEDLCGLSPFNQISASQLAFVLQSMKQSDAQAAFYHSLPVSGKSGTLRYFGHNRSFKGHFRGKSGSIKRVYAYAGYLTSVSGKEYIVVAMLNRFSCSPKEAKAFLVDFFDYVYNEF